MNHTTEEHKFEDDLNPRLISAFKEFVDSVETRDDFSPRLKIDKLYYSIKFFKIENDVFFTIRINYTFPKFELFNNSYYVNDSTCMFYFNVSDRNLIIIDYPESKGHSLFIKKKERNVQVIKEMRDYYSLKKKVSVRPSNPDIHRLTYKVNKVPNGVELIKQDTILLPPPYISEKDSHLPIIEDD